MILVIWSVLNQ